MNNDFELMLQLHAEEGESIVVDTAPSEPPTPSNDVPVTKDGQKASYGLKVDPQTGRRSVVMFGGEEETPQAEPQEQQVPQQQAQPQQEVPQPNQQDILFNGASNENIVPYRDTAELMQAIQSGQVDERRIPMEQAFAYANYKQQLMQQAMQQQQPEQVQPQQEESRIDFFNKIDELARAAALRDIGLSEEQMATAEYSDDDDIVNRAAQYETSMAWHRNAIMAQVQAEQERAMQQQAQVRQLYGDIDNKVAEYRKTEPAFEQINVMMNNYYTELPYNEAVKYANAIQAYQKGNITQEQAQALQEYYDKTRVAYYAKKNNLGTINNPSPRIPKVERPGSSTQDYDDNPVTAEQLRNATDYRARRELIGRILQRQHR
jgi:hypothetical protein